MEICHIPVLLDTILNDFLLPEDKLAIDATLGEGGHSLAFLKKYSQLNVIGLERDPVILKKCRERLAAYSDRFTGININFKNSENIFKENSSNYDLVLFDLGISQFHYKESCRGFAFAKDEELDMRLDPDCEYSAKQIINSFPENELADIFYKYGEEKKSRQIASLIVSKRKNAAINTTFELKQIAARYYPKNSKINPATRIFQAIRIYVNNELEAIENGLTNAIDYLKPGGRVAVITYHSLEDRITKNCFKKYLKPHRNINKYREQQDKFDFINLAKKPIIASEEELRKNPSSRSAKLRVLQKN